MEINSSGGGYFYGPFVSAQGFGTFNITPGVGLGVYGLWAHLAPPIPTGRGRWLELLIWPDGYGSIYTVQIGLGIPSAEGLYQPSDGTGFYIDWFSAIKWIVPFRISFPTSTGKGKELCVRCASIPGAGLDLHAAIYLWN
jgi:hypothetical protein